ENVFARPAEPLVHGGNPEHIPVQANLYDLLGAYQALSEQMAGGTDFSITPEKISVKEKMTGILDLLETRKSVTFSDLAANCADKGEIIATFLAILEVVRLNLVGISQ
ncbi:MAG: segregation/condensation protein A, partial [Desulfobacterales bacterium]|nr:segregation/condensation protein A [Desulfobacterales bacterium]